MTFKSDFNRFAGLTTLPGLPTATEGVKDEAYREGLSAGDAVVQALGKGWAKTPKENTKKAWAPIVAKYAGEQEFMNDSQWAKGFGSALTGHYGKEMKLEASEAEDDVAAIILKQMGGFGRLKAMIGAKNFSKTADSLTFQWPSKQRSTGNALKVTLKGDDTYDMEFFNGPKSVKKYDGVYNDQLKSIFEKQTGLYLTMSAVDDGPPLAERAFHHGTVRQWQNGRHMKNGTGWERIKTGRPHSYASKMPTVLDVVQGNAPPESLGPPIAAMPSLGVVGATAESVEEDMTVSEALLVLDAQLSGEEAFDEDIMKMVFGVLRKVTGRKEPKANKTIPPERPGILFKTNMYKQTRLASLRSREH